MATGMATEKETLEFQPAVLYLNINLMLHSSIDIGVE